MAIEPIKILYFGAGRGGGGVRGRVWGGGGGGVVGTHWLFNCHGSIKKTRAMIAYIDPPTDEQL